MAATTIKHYPGSAPISPGPVRNFTVVKGDDFVEVPNPKVTAFSRAAHFAVLLLPAVIALIWVIARDGDESFLIQLREIFALILGVGGALGVLYAMDYVADKKL